MSNLISTFEAAEILGVPEKEFTRLAQAMSLKPAQPGTKSQPRMWDRAMIEELHNGPEGDEVREVVRRKARLDELLVTLESEYPDWKDALKPAAKALFNFNRFAKWENCTKLRRQELYTLKEDLIRRLYQSGYCEGLVIHTAEVEEEYEDLESENQPKEFLAFCFLIDGSRFHWHVPRKKVDYEFELKDFPQKSPGLKPWQPKSGEKEIAITEDEFLQAEALIWYVLKGFSQQEKEEKEAARQARREQMRKEGLARQAELRKQREESEE